jgi:hypothetical protein
VFPQLQSRLSHQARPPQPTTVNVCHSSQGKEDPRAFTLVLSQVPSGSPKPFGLTLDTANHRLWHLAECGYPRIALDRDSPGIPHNLPHHGGRHSVASTLPQRHYPSGSSLTPERSARQQPHQGTLMATDHITIVARSRRIGPPSAPPSRAEVNPYGNIKDASKVTTRPCPYAARPPYWIWLLTGTTPFNIVILCCCASIHRRH